MPKNAYKDIISMMNAQSKAQTPAEKLAADFQRYVSLSRKSYTPSAAIKPSGIYGCVRMQYFVLTEAEVDAGHLESSTLISMANAGTDRHVRIQNAFMDMENYNISVNWIPLREIMSQIQQKGINTRIRREVDAETLCYNEDYNASFRCDGVFLYDSKIYILEWKTVEQRKWQGITQPTFDHKLQASCYSIFLGIPDVMFFYEDRNLFGIKSYMFTPNEKEIESLKVRMKMILAFADRKIMPAPEKDKCNYCNYKNACKLVIFDADADGAIRREFMDSGNEIEAGGEEI